MILQILAIWSLISLPFLNPACTSWSSRFTYGCSLVWRIVSITLLTCEMKTIIQYLEHSLALPFLWDWNENQPYWVFWICWHIECSALTASSSRILNSSAGILSPPLALFIVILPKAHLTLHSRMSGSQWVITPSWLSLRTSQTV